MSVSSPLQVNPIGTRAEKHHRLLLWLGILVVASHLWRFKPAQTASTTTTVASDHHEDDEHPQGSSKPRIAFLLTMVPSRMWTAEAKRRVMRNSVDALINKACYAHIWNYDFIINTTSFYEHNNLTASRPWLEYGAWNRVPHLQQLAESQRYDWVLYGDHDFLIRDISRPIESLLQDLKIYGHDESASILLPADFAGPVSFGFSSFALMLRTNNDFSESLLRNWMNFGMGLCPKGNYVPPPPSDKHPYRWEDSDQPGLWYSLVKTHEEFLTKEKGNNNHSSSWTRDVYQCNNETGYLRDLPNAMKQVSPYFKQRNEVKGNHGKYLAGVPKDQHILWSTYAIDAEVDAWDGHGPFAVNSAMAVKGPMAARLQKAVQQAFAVHSKFPAERWQGDMKVQLEHCKKTLGCYARYDEHVNGTETLKVGCGGNVYYSGII